MHDVRVVEGEDTISGELKVMDTEISALEGKLSKAREVKAGMMSALQGGKIRLVESGCRLEQMLGSRKFP